MWLSPVTTVAPATEPITVDAATTYLRLDDDDELYSEIAGFIASARAQVEAITSTRLIEQTVELRAAGFADLCSLPIGPIISITAVSYIDTLGQPQTLDPSAYELFGADLAWGIRPVFNTRWPSTRCDIVDAVKVTAIAGYPTAAAMPRDVRLALLKLVRGMLDDQAVDVSDLLANHRIWL